MIVTRQLAAETGIRVGIPIPIVLAVIQALVQLAVMCPSNKTPEQAIEEEATDRPDQFRRQARRHARRQGVAPDRIDALVEDLFTQARTGGTALKTVCREVAGEQLTGEFPAIPPDQGTKVDHGH
jgi:hypothetical protein